MMMNTLYDVAITTKNILLIHDEISVQEFVTLCFKDLAGWNLATADSSFKGLQIAEIDHPDVIVLDLSIRGSFMFLQQLRNNLETQAIPVVVLSTETGVRGLHPQFLQQYQIAGVILKPFNPATLPLQIATLLGWEFIKISNFYLKNLN